jgi:hypothetical protein
MTSETKNNPWRLYDQLIDSIPCNLEVVDCLVGVHWVLVRSVGVGIAMTPPEGDRCLGLAGTMRGKGLRDCAQLVKSWNWMEAAVGVAAINSFFNAPETLAGRWSPSQCVGGGANIFDCILPAIKGRKVAVIGHFPNLEPLAAQCQLHILERRPQSDDFPDPACEYLLPTMDYVFITGSTFINKTLPRLLALSCGAKTVVVGPSTPLSPLLFEHGASLLAGTVVRDAASVWLHVAESGDRSIFQHGAEMMKITATDRKVSSQFQEIVGQGGQ